MHFVSFENAFIAVLVSLLILWWTFSCTVFLVHSCINTFRTAFLPETQIDYPCMLSEREVHFIVAAVGISGEMEAHCESLVIQNHADCTRTMLTVLYHNFNAFLMDSISLGELKVKSAVIQICLDFYWRVQSHRLSFYSILFFFIEKCACHLVNMLSLPLMFFSYRWKFCTKGRRIIWGWMLFNIICEWWKRAGEQHFDMGFQSNIRQTQWKNFSRAPCASV